MERRLRFQQHAAGRDQTIFAAAIFLVVDCETIGDGLRGVVESAIRGLFDDDVGWCVAGGYFEMSSMAGSMHISDGKRHVIYSCLGKLKPRSRPGAPAHLAKLPGVSECIPILV